MVKTPRRPGTAIAALATAAVFSAGFATGAAAEYPTRDITMIVPFAAGGGSDVVARNIANVINGLGLLPVTVIVENRPGGSGAIGYSYLAQQEGNPYYVGTVSAGFYTTPLTGGSPVTYRDFTPLAAIATDPFVLAVAAESDIHTLEDLQAQGSLVTGTSGAVSDPTMLAHILEDILDISIQVVPYDSGGEVLSAQLGGHTDFIFLNPSEILPQVEAGELRAVVVTTEERMSRLPEVPTMLELGHDVTVQQLRGLLAPQGVSDEVIAFWEDILEQVADSDMWREQYLDRFLTEPAFLPSEPFGESWIATSDQYEALMRDLGIID